MTWQLEPHALETLRDRLIERGMTPEHTTRENGAAPDAAAFENTTPSHRGSDVSPGGSPEADTLLRRIGPFLELLYLMKITDGKRDERERQLLRGVLRTLGGSNVPSAAVDQLLAGFDAEAEREGIEVRLERVAGGLSADRLDAETAFTLTATMALADGDVDTPEHALLTHLAELLGISASRTLQLVAQCPLAPPLKAQTRPAP